MAPEDTAKIKEATAVIESCIGEHGIWASPHRYKYQCWTRDFVIAAEDALFDMERADVVKTHLFGQKQ